MTEFLHVPSICSVMLCCEAPDAFPDQISHRREDVGKLNKNENESNNSISSVVQRHKIKIRAQ
jgi:hypothetical protein